MTKSGIPLEISALSYDEPLLQQVDISCTPNSLNHSSSSLPHDPTMEPVFNNTVIDTAALLAGFDTPLNPPPTPPPRAQTSFACFTRVLEFARFCRGKIEWLYEKMEWLYDQLVPAYNSVRVRLGYFYGNSPPERF